MARPKDDTWVVKLDEYHPDAGTAAKYADQEARLYTFRIVAARLKALMTLERPMTSQEQVELVILRDKRNEYAKAIADFNEAEKGGT